MNRRSFLKWANLAGLAAGFPSASTFAATAPEKQADPHEQASAANNAASPNTILLKDYRPVSIYKIPVTRVAKAKFPIIDMHSHPYAKTAAGSTVGSQHGRRWRRGTIILTMAIGAEFDGILRSIQPDRFEMWCDSTCPATTSPDSDPGPQLERCRQAGARRGRNPRQGEGVGRGQVEGAGASR
jgi:hypothetical protein